MQLAAGDRLAQYGILGPLGAGGMGEVYRARDEKLGREVALKVLPLEGAASAEAMRRFGQEARAASALNHPNIVTIYDVGQTDGMAWMAMELVDGSDLRSVMIREPLTLKSALRIAVKIADGLAAAHDRSIVHRDLKPDNVMVTPEGFVKILDFGLAKQMSLAASDDVTIPHTTPGMVFGTVAYMSPEQAAGREMDYRSDQFSFGVMLYEMFTHVRPFDRDTKPETLAAIIRDDPEPPSSLQPSMPYELERIIMRCLARNPRDRYGSTRDLARDLREIRDDMTHSSGGRQAQFARVSTSPPTDVLRVTSTGRKWVYTAVAVVVVAALAVMWLRRARTVAGQQVDSVAVLPFRDLSATAEGRVLADGISELIASRLGEVRDLRVASAFGGAAGVDGEQDPVAFARRRRLKSVVRGSVQREGENLRVTYALIDVATGKMLTTSTVTRPVSELFLLEDAVADALLDALGRERTPQNEPATAALGAEDQRRFVEAVGLLQRVKDERSVDRAVVILENILRNARESGQVNALLARALLYKSMLARRPALIEQAVVYATRGVALSGHDPDTHITLGLLQNAQRQPAAAAESFQRALALRPNDASAIAGLAEAYQGQGRAADAEKMYKRALALRPDAAGTYTQYGSFCYAQGRYEDALRNFRKAVELTPDFSHAHSNVGAALQALGRTNEALAEYERSMALEPTAAGWSNLGTLQFSLKRYGDAKSSYEHAVALAPTDYILWANLGDACHAASAPCETEAWNHAIELATNALDSNPDDVVMRAILASCLAKNGKREEAQTQIRRALEDDPTNQFVLYHAAVVATLRGSSDIAVSWLERAIAAGYPAADIAQDPLFKPLSTLPSFVNAVKSRA